MMAQTRSMCLWSEMWHLAPAALVREQCPAGDPRINDVEGHFPPGCIILEIKSNKKCM
jgi:hypothetical protein